jgi:hypothetical protein
MMIPRNGTSPTFLTTCMTGGLKAHTLGNGFDQHRRCVVRRTLLELGAVELHDYTLAVAVACARFPGASFFLEHEEACHRRSASHFLRAR